MMITLLLASWLALSHGPSQAPAGNDADLEADLRRTIAASGAEVAVALRSVDGGGELLIDADRPFHAASMMKVPVMIELFRQAKTGPLSLDDPLPVRNQFRSIVDDSIYALSQGDDSDKEIYAAIGQTLTLRALCEAMITVSSNFATNLLIEKLGGANIQKTVAALGADGVQVLRGVEDQKAFEQGLNNTITARGLLILFEQLAHGQAVDAQADAEMIGILKRQKFNDGIPAGLAAGTAVAHKTGSITKIHHDGGIVYASRPYVLVVLVRGIEDDKKSTALIAQLSRMIFAVRQRQP